MNDNCNTTEPLDDHVDRAAGSNGQRGPAGATGVPGEKHRDKDKRWRPDNQKMFERGVEQGYVAKRNKIKDGIGNHRFIHPATK